MKNLRLSLIASLGMAIFGGLLAATPAQGLTPGVQAQVAYSNGGRIFVMDSHGEDRVLLQSVTETVRNIPGGLVDPVFSPDGTRIAFALEPMFDETGSDIWVMNANGSTPRRVLDGTETDHYSSPSWLPDSQGLVVGHTVFDGSTYRPGLIEIGTDGSARRDILRLPAGPGRAINRADVSPDGQSALFVLGAWTVDQDNEVKPGRLESVNLTSGARLLVAPKSFGGSWAPDGTQIVHSKPVDDFDNPEVCSAFDCRKSSRLFITSPDGLSERQVTGSEGDERYPDWSADGSTIIFQSNRNLPSSADAYEIYSVKPDGECLTWLTNGTPASTTPSWAPVGGTSLVACGAGDRPATLEITRPLDIKDSGYVSRYWLGNRLGNHLFSGRYGNPSDTGPINYFTYDDCPVWESKACGESVLEAEWSTCRLLGTVAENFGPGRTAWSLSRGTLVNVGWDDGGRKVAYVVAGDRVVAIYWGYLDRTVSRKALIDAIRPLAGGPNPGTLPGPRFPVGDVERMKRVVKVVKRTGSVKKTARILKMKKRDVKGNIAMNRQLRRVGKIRTLKCPKVEPEAVRAGMEGQPERLATGGHAGGSAISREASPTLTPDSKAELVFSSGGRIVSVGADGSGRQELTNPSLGFGNVNQGDVSPEISPDGTRMVFVREDELRDDRYRTNLMVANRDGSDAKPIVRTGSGVGQDGESGLYAPAWSADGSKIYYIDGVITTGKEEIWTSRVIEINADGSGRRVLAERTLDFNELEDEFGDDEDVALRGLAKYWYFFDVDPSPDGSKLLVGSAGIFGFSGLVGKLRVLDLASGEMSVLEESSLGGSWSADGTKIAFMSQRQKLHEDCYELNCSYTTKIYVMNADGSDPKRVTQGKARGNEFYPSWSADGTRIAFASDRNYPSGYLASEVYSVRTDGTCLTWLTNGYPASTYPKWAPEEAGTEPGACGAAGRKPLVNLTPPTKSPTGQPNYWVGRDFRGLLSTYDSGPGEFLDYNDCGFFEAKRCQNLPRFSITSEDVCHGPLQWSLRFGKFHGMRQMRGALISGGQPGRLQVTTGRQTLGIRVDAGHTRGKGAKVQMAIFRALRRVGAGAPEKRFPEARLSRRSVRNAARLARRVELGLPLGTRNLEKKRAYLRFHRAIERLGGVKTVPCPAPEKRPGSNIPGPLPVEPLASPVDGNQFFEMIKDREGTP